MSSGGISNDNKCHLTADTDTAQRMLSGHQNCFDVSDLNEMHLVRRSSYERTISDSDLYRALTVNLRSTKQPAQSFLIKRLKNHAPVGVTTSIVVYSVPTMLRNAPFATMRKGSNSELL